MMLSKDFSQVVTSPGYFPRWQLPKCAKSQAATSEVCPSCSARPPLHCRLRRLRWSNLTFGKLPLGKLHIWEVATWVIVTWVVALVKMPNT